MSAFRKTFIRQLNEGNAKKGDSELTDEEEGLVEQGINTLLGLEHYLLPTLEITSDADEGMISEIFVRVNSRDQSLKQDDFIMALLSVYKPEMRSRIEKFCEDSHVPADGVSYNRLVKTSVAHIIRAAVGLGIKRDRLRCAYQILRGKNLKTGEITPEMRAENFEKLGKALDRVLDLSNWKSSLKSSKEMLPSRFAKGNGQDSFSVHLRASVREAHRVAMAYFDEKGSKTAPADVTPAHGLLF